MLYERGWIDRSLVKTDRSSRYSINGKKTDYDNVTGQLKDDCKKYSLKYLLSNCDDFKEEKCDLEHLTCELSARYDCGCSILFSPKYHCEIAGEGIEYSWGCAKKLYRKKPLKIKRSREQFVTLVKNSIGHVSPLMVNKFLMKARRYMIGYKHKKLKEDDFNNGENEIKWSYDYNEKLHKIYKTHRDANAFDSKFIKMVMLECIGVDDMETKEALKLQMT